jgi:putative addiction module component (TIGR02574 family)
VTLETSRELTRSEALSSTGYILSLRSGPCKSRDGGVSTLRSGKISSMERNLEELASEALQLSVESRAALAKWLLDSLDDLAPEEYERMWVEEAARRYQQLKSGTATSIASEEVFSRLDARRALR